MKLEESKYRLEVQSNEHHPILFIKKFPENLKSINFSLKRRSDGEDETSDKNILFGQDKLSDYSAELPSAKKSLTGIYGKYVLAKVSKTRQRIVFEECPVVEMEQSIRATEGMQIESHRSKDMHARNALGQAFGTKKRKQMIRAIENNKIDADFLDENASRVLHSNLEDKTSTLAATREVNRLEIMQSMPLPPFNLNAESVEDAYPLSGLLPEHVAKTLPLMQLLKLGSKDELDDVLKSMRTPPVLSDRLNALLKQRNDKSVFPKICLIIYVIYLFRFKSLRHKNISVSSISKMFWNVSPTVLQFLVETFTESQRSIHSSIADDAAAASHSDRTLTPYCKSKLTSYILALLLHLDNFKLNIVPWKRPLLLTYGDLCTHLRVMGCTIQPLSKSQLEAQGYSKEEKVANALLSLPLKIQVPSRGAQTN